MPVQLSSGEILRLNNTEGSTTITSPLTVQVISNIQPFGNPPSDEAAVRHRCMISDGDFTALAVIPGHLKEMVKNNTITRYTVLRITKGNVTKKDRNNDTPPIMFVIILEAEIVETLGEKIGDPQKLPPPGELPTPRAAAPAPPPPAQPSFMNQANDVKPSFGSAVGFGQPAAGAPAPPPVVHPIADLNPYHSKWTIRARVTQKSSIKSWNKPSSQGRLFSANLLDESGEIRTTTFTQQVDRFYPMLEVGKIYYISNAQVKMAKPQFSNVNNQYELTFDDNTQIEPCQDSTATSAVPQEHFDFIPLGNLMKFEKNNIVDVLGVVKEVQDVSEITSKSSDRKMTKRDLLIVDKSGFQVRATLWGAEAEGFAVTGDSDSVVAFKGMRVGDFGGRTLSLPSTGTYTVNPDISEAHALRGWYDAEGRNVQYQSYGGMSGGPGESGGAMGSNEKFESQLKTMSQIQSEDIGSTETAEFFYLKGTVVFIRSENLAYPSCPSENCNKKVIEDDASGQWRCEKCERTYPSPQYRYIFSMNVNDHTGQCWLQCFNEIGEQLFGKPADHLIHMKQEDEVEFKKLVDAATFTEFKFRCKARSETFNDQTRVRITAVGMYPVDYKQESKRLSRLIESY